MSSAGERIAVSLPGCKLLQPYSLPVERSDLHNRAAEHRWAERRVKSGCRQQRASVSWRDHRAGIQRERRARRGSAPCVSCSPGFWCLVHGSSVHTSHPPSWGCCWFQFAEKARTRRMIWGAWGHLQASPQGKVATQVPRRQHGYRSAQPP